MNNWLRFNADSEVSFFKEIFKNVHHTSSSSASAGQVGRRAGGIEERDRHACRAEAERPQAAAPRAARAPARLQGLRHHQHQGQLELLFSDLLLQHFTYK